MMLQSICTLAMGVLFVFMVWWLVRLAYRMTVFRLTAEHREIILKSAYLLEDKHMLSEAEVSTMCAAILGLYDRRFKSFVAKGVFKSIVDGSGLAKPRVVRKEIQRVSDSFSAIVLAENPFTTLRMLKALSDRREIKVSQSEPLPMARAEILIASQMPAFANEALHTPAAA